MFEGWFSKPLYPAANSAGYHIRDESIEQKLASDIDLERGERDAVGRSFFNKSGDVRHKERAKAVHEAQISRGDIPIGSIIAYTWPQDRDDWPLFPFSLGKVTDVKVDANGRQISLDFQWYTREVPSGRKGDMVNSKWRKEYDEWKRSRENQEDEDENRPLLSANRTSRSTTSGPYLPLLYMLCLYLYAFCVL